MEEKNKFYSVGFWRYETIIEMFFCCFAGIGLIIGLTASAFGLIKRY
jgi:hypothetical protein